MSKTVLVGCKLPCGIELDGPRGTITINGKNTSMIANGFGLTHIDETDWAYLLAVYSTHAAFKNNAIFATGSDSVADVAELAEDLKSEKTGMEGLDPTKPGAGVEPEDKGKLAKALNENAGKGTASKTAKKAADKAAAIELAQTKG